MWCHRLHKYVHENGTIDSLLNANFVFYLLNYSKESKNLDLLAELQYPQRFGFPVLLVLDENGRRLHTQNTAFLEKDKSYDEKKVAGFLRNWSPAAIDPDSYQ